MTDDGLSDRLLARGATDGFVTDFGRAHSVFFHDPDGRLFECEQGGALRVVAGGQLRATPFLRLSVDSNGERGLLGVAVNLGVGTVTRGPNGEPSQLERAKKLRDRKLGVTIESEIRRGYEHESVLGNLFADLMKEARPDADVTFLASPECEGRDGRTLYATAADPLCVGSARESCPASRVSVRSCQCAGAARPSPR